MGGHPKEGVEVGVGVGRRLDRRTLVQGGTTRFGRPNLAPEESLLPGRATGARGIAILPAFIYCEGLFLTESEPLKRNWPLGRSHD